MKFTIKEYVWPDGSNPFGDWYRGLDNQARSKVDVAITRMELGNTSNVEWFSGLGEYKINWGPGYRIYLARVGKQIIMLFGGGTKKSQRADIKKARELHQEYKET